MILLIRYAAIISLIALAFLTGSFRADENRVTGHALIKGAASNSIKDDDPQFLVVSDIHLCDDSPEYIIYNKKGDSGSDLWRAAKDKIGEILSGPNSPKFILLLGDLTYHTTNRERAMHNVGTVLNDFQKMADKAYIPVIYVPGNNDSPYANYGSYSLDSIRKYADCKTCWPLLGGGMDAKQKNKAEILQGSDKSGLGFYACYPLGISARLKIIVLNTMPFSVKYVSNSGDSIADAITELGWLQDQLNDAEHKHEHVIIAMHIPPGKDYSGKYFWKTSIKFDGKTIQDTFLNMVGQHKNIIVGVLASHTHMDNIRKLYGDDNSSQFSALELSVPGIAPGHGNYPAMDLVTYDPDNFDIEDVETLFHPYEHKQEIKNEELITDWGNSSFTFNKVFGNKKGKPLREFIATLSKDKLQEGQQEIYRLENEKKHKTDVDSCIEVFHQP